MKNFTDFSRLAGVFLLLVLTGCATVQSSHDTTATVVAPNPDTVASVLWQGGQGGWIYRVDMKPGAPATQPVQLDANWLRGVLASIDLVREHASERTLNLTVFNDQQLERLVPALVNGLANAQAGQGVVFALLGPLPGARIFPQTVVTTGRVFVSAGRLHIVFGRVLDVVHENSAADRFVPGMVAQAIMPSDEKMRSTQWGADLERRDWIAFAVQRASGPLPALPASVTPEQKAVAPVQTGADTAGSTTVAPAQTTPATSVREKLELLKQLYEDDLITQQEYASERAEVLEQL